MAFIPLAEAEKLGIKPEEVAPVETKEEAVDVKVPQQESGGSTFVPVDQAKELGITSFEEFNPNNIVQQSPLNKTERIALQSYDEPHKKKYLSSKYGEDNVKQLEGLSFAIRDPKDGKWKKDDPDFGKGGWDEFLADAGEELFGPEGVRQVSQAMGAALGAAAGTPAAPLTGGGSVLAGASVGAGAGRMVGNEIAKFAAKLAGVRGDETLQDLYTDQLQQAAIGSAGQFVGTRLNEGVNLNWKELGRFKNQVAKSKAFQDFSKKFIGAASWGKVPKYAVDDIVEKGSAYVRDKKLQEPQFFDDFIKRGSKAIDTLKQEASTTYEGIVTPAKNKKISVREIFDSVQNNLYFNRSKPQIDIINNTVEPQSTQELQRSMEQLLGEIRTTFEKKFGVDWKKLFTLDRKVKAHDLWQVRKDWSDTMVNWKENNILLNSGKAVRNGLKNALHTVKEYVDADAEFSETMDFLDDIASETGMKAGKSEASWSRLLEGFWRKPPAVRERLVALNQRLPRGERFLDDGLAWLSAKAWDKLNIPVAAWTSVAGAVAGMAIPNPQVRAAATTAAMMRVLGEPAILSRMLFGTEKGLQLAKTGVEMAGKQVAKAVSPGVSYGLQRSVGQITDELTRSGGAQAAESQVPSEDKFENIDKFIISNEIDKSIPFEKAIVKVVKDKTDSGNSQEVIGPGIVWETWKHLFPDDVQLKKRKPTPSEVMSVFKKIRSNYVGKFINDTLGQEKFDSLSQKAKNSIADFAYNTSGARGFPKAKKLLKDGNLNGFLNEIYFKNSKSSNKETSYMGKKLKRREDNFDVIYDEFRNKKDFKNKK